MIASSPIMRDLLQRCRLYAKQDLPVMITGASGTGKELVARYIHDHSRRSTKTWLPVNCATLVESLFESELFGFEKGAFTGSTQMHQGFFESVDGGTLFLDEIGELPLNLQAKLLRVVEERRVRRIGANNEIPVRGRILVATNRDLEAEIASGRFRSDLFYRLNILHVHVPPLKMRPEDIPLLVQYFLRQMNSMKSISSQTIREMQEYPWPGNVRELRNMVVRMVIQNEESLFPYPTSLPCRDPIYIYDQGIRLSKELEGEIIRKALDRHQGHRIKTADDLGISRSTLYHKMKKFGLLSRR